MVLKRVTVALDDLTQTQTEPYFWVKSVALARDLITYRRRDPQTLFYDTSKYWHLRAISNEKGCFAKVALTCIVKSKAVHRLNPVEEQIESGVQWAQIVHIEQVPHSDITYSKVIGADFRKSFRETALDMWALLVGHYKNRWLVDFSTQHTLNAKKDYLWLKNSQILFGGGSEARSLGYKTLEASNAPL